MAKGKISKGANAKVRRAPLKSAKKPGNKVFLINF
jgi:hypothetical protein